MYQQKIQTARPGLIVLVLDDSASMQDPLVGGTDARYLWVERYTGLILKELLARSNEVRGDTAIIKPRYYLSTVIYGTDPKVWPSGTSGDLDIEQVILAYAGSQDGGAKNSLGLGGLMHGTDARKAFENAYEVLDASITKDRFKDSFPPMVFHMTDGESQTDAGPVAEKMKQLATTDGQVLVVNAFIGTATSLKYSGPEDFPGYLTQDEAGPSPESIALFQMSSEAPEAICTNLVADGIFPEFRQGSRLYFDVRTREMLKHVIAVVGSQGSR